MPFSRLVCLCLLVPALLAGACGDDDDKGSTATKRRVPTTADAVTPTTEGTGGTSAAAALEPLLITDVPAGFVRQSDDVGDTGPSDLAKAIRDDGEDDARDALTKAGFVAGYQRLWVNAEDDELILFLYQFKDEAGTASYEARTLDGLEGATAFDVPGVPDAKGLEHSDDDVSAAVIVFTKGPYLVQVVTNASSLAGLKDRLRPLATAQYQRLPGTVA
jgi:hypothetical protein